MDDLISRQAAIDELKRISFSHWFECGEYLSEDTREIEIISSSKALEVIEALPSAQPQDWMAQNKDRILQAGMEGREVEFRICGRLFAIREKAQ